MIARYDGVKKNPIGMLSGTSSAAPGISIVWLSEVVAPELDAISELAEIAALAKMNSLRSGDIFFLLARQGAVSQRKAATSPPASCRGFSMCP